MAANASSRLLARTVGRLIVPFLLTLAFALWPHLASAATITVDGATCTLPDAITAANSDTNFNGCTLVGVTGADTILLPPLTSLATGPFNPAPDLEGPTPTTATPSITSKIVISGGVSGAIVERSGAAHYRLFFVDSSGDLTLDHVTVRFGNSEIDGGAIHNVGTLTLLDSDIISNTAWLGGGIANGDEFFDKRSTLTITNSNILSNMATSGGGIYNRDSGTVNLANVVLTANVAGNEGGGFANHGTAILTNTIFISNTAKVFGGGFSNYRGQTIVDDREPYRGQAILLDSDFFSNTAFYGGGLYATGSFGGNDASTKLTNVNFIANVATGSGDLLFGGGGIYNNGTSTIIISNTNFIRNRAQYGGGIHNGSDTIATIILMNSRVISNIADYGGGIFNVNMAVYGQDARITITDSEFRANRATFKGGGIYQEYGDVSIVRSRFIDNWAGDTGAALLHYTGGVNLYGLTRIEKSCIVNNTDIAVTVINYEGGGTPVSNEPIEASNNWWGSATGPTGNGSGTGDSVSNDVIVTSFLPSPILNCPTRATRTFYLPQVEQ